MKYEQQKQKGASKRASKAHYKHILEHGSEKEKIDVAEMMLYEQCMSEEESVASSDDISLDSQEPSFNGYPGSTPRSSSCEDATLIFPDQGFDDSKEIDDDDDDQPYYQTQPPLQEIEINGTTFAKGNCFTLNGLSPIKGISKWVINYFVSEEAANCTPIIKWNESVLKIGKTQEDFRQPLWLPASFDNFLLPKLAMEINLAKHDVGKIPEMKAPVWCYEPRNGMSFAFWKHLTRVPNGKRQEKIGALDGFSCAGGASAGMAHHNFHIKVGVDKEVKHLRAFRLNHGGELSEDDEAFQVFTDLCKTDPKFLSYKIEVQGQAAVWEGCLSELLDKFENDKLFRDALGVIHHVHLSPPCTGFSSAKTKAKDGDDELNALCLLIIRVAAVLRPLTISFENVTGMWRNDKEHQFIGKYLLEIYMGLLHHGYQFRQVKMRDCDYGGVQKRERLIILASQMHLPLPPVPPKTHCPPDPLGNPTDKSLQVYRTAGDVLRPFLGKFPVKGRNELLIVDPKYEVKWDEPFPALRASKLPKHPIENRLITIEEAHSSTFDPGFRLFGNDKDRRCQIGNAIPFPLAKAVFGSIASVLEFNYMNSEKEYVAPIKMLTKAEP